MRSYPSDALFASRTQEPTGGVPSLSDSEIVQLYNWWLNRPPDGSELNSERGNALKYSAAGIERQIAMRAGNVASSGIRGDEGSTALTVAAPIIDSHVGSVVTVGASAIAHPDLVTSGPLGLMTPDRPVAGYYNIPGAPMTAGFSGGGLSMTTILIGAAVLGAAWFLMKGRG